MRRGTRSIFHTMGSRFQIEPNLLSALFLPKIPMSQNGSVCHSAGEWDGAGQGDLAGLGRVLGIGPCRGLAPLMPWGHPLGLLKAQHLHHNLDQPPTPTPRRRQSSAVT